MAEQENILTRLGQLFRNNIVIRKDEKDRKDGKSKSISISPLKNDKINIVVTQPRRMAAIAMSKRLCYERNDKLGEIIGYTIRFDNRCSAKT